MISFLTGLPLWLSGLLLVGLPTVLAMFGPILVRRYVTLEKLEKNNEVAGFKFAVVGVLYAVLLGFAIIVVWERFSDAETNVATGSSCCGDYLSLVARHQWTARHRPPRRPYQLSESGYLRWLARHGAW